MAKVEIQRMVFSPDEPATIFYKDHIIHVWKGVGGDWYWDAIEPEFAAQASTPSKEEALAAAMWVVDNGLAP